MKNKKWYYIIDTSSIILAPSKQSAINFLINEKWFKNPKLDRDWGIRDNSDNPEFDIYE